MSPPNAPESQWGHWRLYSSVATAACIAVILVNTDTAAQGLSASAAAAALLLVLLAVYMFLVRMVGYIHSGGWLAWLYVIFAVVVYLVALALNPWANVALFVIAPQIFLLLRPVASATTIVLINVLGFGIQVLVRPVNMADLTQLVTLTLVIILASIFYSNRLIWVSRQSQERGKLITQLTEQQREIARLSEQEGAAAERNRIAREMHDTLAQGFASIVTLGHALQVHTEALPPTAARHIDLITETAQENLAESRRIIAAMTPGRLAASTLDEALARVTQQCERESGIAADFTFVGHKRQLPAPVEVVVLRVVQEALTNVRKHSRAHHVHVTLTVASDWVRAMVDDDGSGFDTSESRGGFGLTGMTGRAAEVNGEVVITSRPGSGTTVVVTVMTERDPPRSEEGAA